MWKRSIHFQPGEGPSRGLLRDCTTSPINRLHCSILRVNELLSLNGYEPLEVAEKKRSQQFSSASSGGSKKSRKRGPKPKPKIPDPDGFSNKKNVPNQFFKTAYFHQLQNTNFLPFQLQGATVDVKNAKETPSSKEMENLKESLNSKTAGPWKYVHIPSKVVTSNKDPKQ